MIRAIVIALAFKAIYCEKSAPESTLTTEYSSKSSVHAYGQAASSTTPEPPSEWERQRVSIKDHPYMVALYNSAGQYRCTGTIITPLLILTAYHCVLSKSPGSVRALSEDNRLGGQKIFVNRNITHQNSNIYTDDIALVLLRERIENAQPVKLGILPSNAKTAFVQALGWGRTPRGYPRNLTKVKLEVTPAQECLSLYGGHPWICTETKYSCTCDGDDGGPIMYNGKQVGIVSHSYVPLCCTGVPTANVNLAKYLGWIQDQAKLYQ